MKDSRINAFIAGTALVAAVLMMAASGAIGAVLCFFLVETAPVKVRAAMARAG